MILVEAGSYNVFIRKNEIETLQFSIYYLNMKKFKQNEIPDLKFQKAKKKPIPVRCIQIDEPFEVETMEGVMQGKEGDYLIVGIHGEMYPVDKEIFLKTYDVVNS